MSRWQSERYGPRSGRLAIGLDRDSLVWRADAESASPEPPSRIPWPAAGDAPFNDAVQELSAALAQARSIWVVVSHRCAEHWLQTPPPGTCTLQELRLLVAARSERLWGWPADQTLVTARWEAMHAFPCVAVPRAGITPLLTLMGPHAARSRWSSAWAVHQAGLSSQRDTTVHAFRTPGRISLWRQTGRHIEGLLTLPLQPDSDHTDLAAPVQQFVHALDASDPAPWLALCAAPATATDEALAALDLAGRFTPHTPAALLPVGWATDGRAAWRSGLWFRRASTGLGLLALAGAGVTAGTNLDNTEPMPATPPTAAAAPRDAVRQRDADRRTLEDLDAQLRTPWSALLDQLVDSLPDDVRLQRIEPDPARQRLRLVTEARSLSAGLQHAQSLPALPAVAAVRLDSHEPTTSADDVSSGALPGIGTQPPQTVRLHLDLTLRPLPW